MNFLYELPLLMNRRCRAEFIFIKLIVSRSFEMAARGGISTCLRPSDRRTIAKSIKLIAVYESKSGLLNVLRVKGAVGGVRMSTTGED